MTDKEKAIITAHTGIFMLEGGKFPIFHKYIEDICCRPIYTHELESKAVWDEIKYKSEEDFLSVCRSEDSLDKVLEIIDAQYTSTCDRYSKVGYMEAARDELRMLRAAVMELKGEQE